MDIHTNIPLKNYTTMRIGGNARFLTDVKTPEELASICQKAKEKSLPIFVLGGGSNIIARDEGFNGVVIRMQIPGFEVIAEDLGSMTIRIGAGEIWDSVVEKTVKMGLSGIEAMSNIPGTIGAAPIQNMGAYGQEISDTLQCLEAYDNDNDKFVRLQNSDCGFSYRDSVFRTREKGRFVIINITLKLSKSSPQPPFYDALQKYFDDAGVTIFTQSAVRDAVIKLRSDKLPDPKIIPSAGSFFKNAIVEKWQVTDLQAIDPNIPLYDMGNGTYKVPTGWLIEHAGLKGQLLYGMRVYEKNALVLVNESAGNYENLAKAREEIVSTVRAKYHIQIEQEPLEI